MKTSLALILCFTATTIANDQFLWSATFQDSAQRHKAPRVAERSTIAREGERRENEIKNKRHEITSQLQETQDQLNRVQDSKQDNSKSDQVSGELDILKQIDAVLAQQQTAQEKKKSAQAELDGLSSESSKLEIGGLASDQSRSFLHFDQLKSELESVRIRLDSHQARIEAAKDAFRQAEQAKDQKGAAARLAKDQLDNNSNQEKKDELELLVKRSALEQRLANETLILRQLQLDLAELSEEVATTKRDLLEQKIEKLRKLVVFGEDDLQEILVQIEKQEAEYRRARHVAESKSQFAKREWEAAQRTNDVNNDSLAVNEEIVAKRVNQQRFQHRFEILNKKIERLTRKKEVWRRRHKVANEAATNAELTQWKLETEDAIAGLKRDKQVQLLASEDVRKDITSLNERIQSLSEDQKAAGKWLALQVDDWKAYLSIDDENLADIEANLRLHEELLYEIQGDIDSWSTSERLASIWASIVSIWNMEITAIDERPITIGKIVVSLLFLFVGFFAARWIAYLFGNRLLTRFGMNEGATAAIKTIIFYVLVILFALLALRLANVPLTVFTLLGGALAIGVGFGSQTIISNFISGLILIAERPIKVGDLIQIDTLIGNVTKIGARSTSIRTGDNLDIIVPNSKFLESNVLNFTLGDDKFRTHIKIGLAYGSPTRDATKIMIRAAEEHGLILQNPKPFVWFRDFGDNALSFELHVWIKVRTLGERLRVESDLRYHIDMLFREAGIVIAFPQRDLHLDTLKPLDIRLISEESREATGPQNEKRAA